MSENYEAVLIRFKLTRSIARIHLRQMQIHVGLLVELAYFVEQSNSSRGEYKHVPPIKTSFYAVYATKQHFKALLRPAIQTSEQRDRQ